jgi:hypothetical protein
MIQLMPCEFKIIILLRIAIESSQLEIISTNSLTYNIIPLTTKGGHFWDIDKEAEQPTSDCISHESLRFKMSIY